MWFKNAIGQEKIDFMFSNKLNIEHVELYRLSMTESNDLEFVFMLQKDKDTIYPKKWNEKKFNALSLTISFLDIISMKIEGAGIHYFCNPEINSDLDFSTIKITHNKISIDCKSKFLSIDEIKPYLDERRD